MNDDMREYFAFEHRDYNGKVFYYKVSGDDRWAYVLEDFVRFLEGIYKYNIKDKIRLKKPGWFGLDPEVDMMDPWQYHYFEIDTEDKPDGEEELTDEDFGNPGLSD